MKKSLIILTLALGIATAAQAIQFSAFRLIADFSMVVENEIYVQDWMLNSESFISSSEQSFEDEIEVKSWMLETWNKNEAPVASESEIVLEDWMLNASDEENKTIALEDWMLNITG